MLSEVDVWQQELNAPAPQSMWHRLQACLFNKAQLLRLSVIVLLSLLIELFLWNNYYFMLDSDSFKKAEIQLPVHPQLNAPALVLDKNNNTLTLPPINMMVKAIEIEAYGGNFFVEGMLSATSEHYAYAFQKISKFNFGSGLGQDLSKPASKYQKALIKFDLDDPVLQLMLSFNQKSLPVPLIISKITINPEPTLNFSWVRLVLMVLGFYLIYITCCSQLYRHQLVVDSQAYKWINRSILGSMLLIATGIMLAYHPQFTTPTGFKQVSLGYLPYGNPQGTLLQEMPTTQEDLGKVDIYIELTHALLVKKQLNLDLWVDPQLLQLNNMYDPTERIVKNIDYYLDRAFYDGKYYCYFGLAPFILIYVPIYLLTGMVPTPVLAIFLATLYALLGMHFLSSRLTSLLCDKCNTTLFVITKLTFYICSLVFYLQTLLVFYLLPYLTCFAALSVAIGCGLGLLMRSKKHGKMCKGSDYLEPDTVAYEINAAYERANKQAAAAATHKAHQEAALEQALAKADRDTLDKKPKAVGAVLKIVKGKNRINSSELSRTADGSWSAELETKENPLLGYWAKVQEFWSSKTNEYLPFTIDIPQMVSMFICGVAVVFVVMSRPLNLLYVVLAVGLIWLLYLFRVRQSWGTKLLNLVSMLVPLTLGAIIVAAYNYARFDSIFEFGQLRQLTGDMVAANTPRLNMEYLKTGFFHALFSNFELTSAFPYVNVRNHTVYTGQYTYFVEHSGLFMLPYFWGLALLPLLWGLKRLSYQGLHTMMPALQHSLGLRCLQLMFSLFYVAMPFMMFLVMYNAGWTQRYLTDITIVAAFIPFLMVMLFDFKWQTTSERILYLAWIGGCIFSCALIFFMSIQNNSSQLSSVNPKLFLELKEIFDPLGFN